MNDNPLLTCAAPPCANIIRRHYVGHTYCSKQCGRNGRAEKQRKAVTCSHPRCANIYEPHQNHPRHVYCGAVCRRAMARAFRIEADHGISVAAYLDLIDAQDHRCAICGQVETSSGRAVLAVDHDHRTLAVRGLLCSRCNVGIGMLGDDPATIEAAAAYIRAAA